MRIGKPNREQKQKSRQIFTLACIDKIKAGKNKNREMLSTAPSQHLLPCLHLFLKLLWFLSFHYFCFLSFLISFSLTMCVDICLCASATLSLSRVVHEPSFLPSLSTTSFLPSSYLFPQIAYQNPLNPLSSYPFPAALPYSPSYCTSYPLSSPPSF